MILNCELMTFKKIKIINFKKFSKWPVQQFRVENGMGHRAID
jgi:hypothetical protein